MARRRGQPRSRIRTLLLHYPFLLLLLLFLALLQHGLTATASIKPSFLSVPVRSSYSSLSPSFSTTAASTPLYPSRHLPPLTTSASRNPNDDDGFSPLLSRRELFVPALLALGSGTLLLRNTIKDQTLYERIHQELFALLSSGREGGRERGQQQQQQQRPLRVLEIGVGEGVNVKYYPSWCDVVGLDPNLKREALSVAQAKAKARNINFSLIEGSAEFLPFPDGSFDAVVSTLVFCSVQNPPQALREVARVLKQGGKFLFVEHVWAGEKDHPILHAVQGYVDPLQALLAEGCHLVRHTDELFVGEAREGGKKEGLFERVEKLERLELDTQWPITVQVAGVLVK